MQNLEVNGRNATAGTDGLLLGSTVSGSSLTNCYFEDCAFTDFPGYQVHGVSNATGSLWGIDFTRCTFNNANNAVNDLVSWQGDLSAGNSVTWRDCRWYEHADGKWSIQSSGGIHIFHGGIVAPSGATGQANGIYCANGYLHLLGTYLEGGRGNASVGIRYSGYGATIAPGFLVTFAQNAQIGDPANPAKPAYGAQVMGTIGSHAAAPNGCDIRVTSGGSRRGTQIFDCGSPAGGGAVVVDDRRGIDGAWGEVIRIDPNGLSAPTSITAGYSAGTAAGVTIDGKFTGNIGTTAYTLRDLVAALKARGLIAV